MAYAVGNVVRGAAIRSWNEAILGALLGAVSGFALYLLSSAETTDLVRKLKTADRSGRFMYVASGILTISAQICVIASMAYIPVSISALITLSSPLMVFPLSYFLLNNEEGITGRTVLGCALTLAGIAIIIAI